MIKMTLRDFARVWGELPHPKHSFYRRAADAVYPFQSNIRFEVMYVPPVEPGQPLQEYGVILPGVTRFEKIEFQLDTTRQEYSWVLLTPVEVLG